MTIFVCGLGRCGSSLVMQMLHGGGYPTFGLYPAFEPEETMPGCSITDLLPKVKGKAVKILDPHRAIWPSAINDAAVIWLDRDEVEQAKSQVKFLQLVAGLAVPGNAWRNVRRGLATDRKKSLAILNGLDFPILEMTFEGILTRPEESARAIQEIIRTPLDIEAMARRVIKRSPKCASGLDVEMYLCAAQIGATGGAE